MSNMSTQLDKMAGGQSNKEQVFNDFADAASPAATYGRRNATCTGLTWGYYGGNVLYLGQVVQVPNGTLALTPSATNYLEAAPSGAIFQNTSGFTSGRMPLYIVTTNAAGVTNYLDVRVENAKQPFFLLSKNVAGDSPITLSQAELLADVIELSGLLTAAITVFVPAGVQGQWTFYNNTTGGSYTVNLAVSGESGLVVAQTKRAILYSDGTAMRRVTADT